MWPADKAIFLCNRLATKSFRRQSIDYGMGVGDCEVYSRVVKGAMDMTLN